MVLRSLSSNIFGPDTWFIPRDISTRSIASQSAKIKKRVYVIGATKVQPR